MSRLSHETLITKGRRITVVRRKPRGLGLDHAFPVDEDQIHVSIKEWLETVLPSAEIHHSPNGGQRSKAEGAKFKRLGTRLGRPDLEVNLPEGRTVFFEVKTQVGAVSEEQRDCITRLKRLGFPVAVVRSIDETRTALRSFGVATREAAA
jgi:hypothetical protein